MVDGTIEKFKARLVIQGFRQKSGIDYFDTYAPVARISTIRLLIAMTSIYSLIIHQMDVKTAFLNSELDEEVYMNQPHGFIMPSNENKCMTRSSTKELFTPFKNAKREFRSSRKIFKTLSLDAPSSSEFDLFSDLKEHFEEEVAETKAETMEEYMCKTRGDYGSGVTRPKIDDKDHFELKG
ncbi:zinc finger, CCHC-type containing protein [Tanacetum coccineum]